MNEQHHGQIYEYISRQLQAGQNPDEIALQLTQAGWKHDVVQQGFAEVQKQMLPSPGIMQPAVDSGSSNLVSEQPSHSQQPKSIPQANGRRRGRLKTGWILLKHSFAILNGNRYLFRYLIMTWVCVLGVNLALLALTLVLSNVFWRSEISYNFLVFMNYFIVFAIFNFYAAALAANILDIYKGERKPYSHYIAAARARIGPILVYTFISSVIGVILNYIAERVPLLGRIIVWLVGAVWTVGTMFVLPIIMDTDKSAVGAIKGSYGLLKQVWGESITAKTGVNVPMGLIQFAFACAFLPLLYFAAFSGSWLIIVFVLIIYVFVFITLMAIGSYANSLINIALYFYGTRNQVPPGFDEEMLNNVIIKRK